jgi:hypothetical protein
MAVMVVQEQMAVTVPVVPVVPVVLLMAEMVVHLQVTGQVAEEVPVIMRQVEQVRMQPQETGEQATLI